MYSYVKIDSNKHGAIAQLTVLRRCYVNNINRSAWPDKRPEM